MIAIEPEQEARLLESIRKESVDKYVKHLITNGGANATLSTAQAAGYLNISTQTLRKLPIQSYDVTGKGGTVCYRVSDLDAYMETRKVNA